jgi:hypothetical protein
MDQFCAPQHHHFRNDVRGQGALAAVAWLEPTGPAGYSRGYGTSWGNRRDA